ncbi:MAG TPA: hypothetical protein VG938_14395 [Verrucomicrobiae bacterium]|nr:hypothetical protein [Verrucomicrobiae bacterium]
MSCKSNSSQAQKVPSPRLPRICRLVTNAINHEDWNSLRKMVKPGMLANNYLNSSKPHIDYSVGKLLLVQGRIDADGRSNEVYSFALENKNGSVNPHWLQITIHENDGRAELVDFWNFGW